MTTVLHLIIFKLNYKVGPLFPVDYNGLGFIIQGHLWHMFWRKRITYKLDQEV